MKSLFTFILLAFASIKPQAQIYVEGILLDSTNSGMYLEIGTGGVSSPYIIDVDYGQSARPRIGYLRLTNEKREAIKFKSMVGALNFFDKNDWEVVDTITEVTTNSIKYLLRKKQSPQSKGQD